jgi:hypothetical protein
MHWCMMNRIGTVLRLDGLLAPSLLLCSLLNSSIHSRAAGFVSTRFGDDNDRYIGYNVRCWFRQVSVKQTFFNPPKLTPGAE